MTPSVKDSEDKVIVDPAELESAGQQSSRSAVGRSDELTLARGTRDQLSPIRASGAATRNQVRGLERDPVAVLRAWPHSSPQPSGDSLRSPPLSCTRRIENKLVFAHFALDLYRETEELQEFAERAHDTPRPERDATPCNDPRCANRVHLLRGALVEACLLVQRVAMGPMTERADIEDRIYELLELLNH